MMLVIGDRAMEENYELAQRIEQWRSERIERVSKAVTMALQENNCEIIAVPQIHEGKIVAIIQIVAK
jgi:hypothetical protein